MSLKLAPREMTRMFTINFRYDQKIGAGAQTLIYDAKSSLSSVYRGLVKMKCDLTNR